MLSEQSEPLVSNSDVEDYEESEKMARTSAKQLVLINFLGRLAWAVVLRFWRLCTTGLLIIILLYCLHGGYLAFAFLVFGMMGKLKKKIEEASRGSFRL